MKIAQVYIDLRVNYGGASKVVYLLSQELAKEKEDDVDVIICGPVEDGLERKFHLSQYDWQGIFSSDLREHLESHGYDIVHVHGYQSFVPYHTVQMKKKLGFPVVFTPHYHPTGNRPRIVRKLFDTVFGRRAFRGSDIITVLSKVEKAQVVQAGADAGKVRMLPNPLDPAIMRKVPEDMARDKYGLSDRVILFVGRLDTNKGLLVLLEAFKALQEREKDVSLCIVGKDLNMGKQLEGIVEKEVFKDVHITGQVELEMLLSFYSCADMLVLPSSYEAFGMVLLEAMAKGVPVIGTYVGGVPELLEEGRDGVIVPYGDVDGLSGAMGRLLGDEGYRDRLIKNGLERAKGFSPENVAKTLRAIYSELPSVAKKNEHEREGLE